MVVEQFSDRFFHRALKYFGFGQQCGSGGKVVHLEVFSDRFLHRILKYFGFGGGCGSGGKVVHLEVFSARFLHRILKYFGFAPPNIHITTTMLGPLIQPDSSDRLKLSFGSSNRL